MAGVEYARALAWGSGSRKGEYEAISPCKYIDLGQNLLEPVLLKWASGNGWKVRFDTTLVHFEEQETADEHGRKIVASLVDNVTGLEYTARTKYLFGADGGRSKVAKILDLPFTTIPGGSLAYNVLVRADMTHLMKHREGNLHVMMALEKNSPLLLVIRQVKPNTEWLFVFLPKGPNVPPVNNTWGEWATIAKEAIGDDSVDVEILDVSGWMVNESSADVISKGNA